MIHTLSDMGKSIELDSDVWKWDLSGVHSERICLQTCQNTQFQEP